VNHRMVAISMRMLRSLKGRAGRGFTLVELLVVISLFVLILAIGVPAFAALLRSTERASAESSLSIGVRAARDIAQRGEGTDGALVFTFENGVARLIPCVFVTQVQDIAADGFTLVNRDVFVPHPLYKAAQMPRGWAVRGYAAPGTIDNEWYSEDAAYGLDVNSGPVAAERQRGNWVFPQTGLYDLEAKLDGSASGDTKSLRHTFMLRFSAQTGTLYTSPAPALVIIQRPSDKARPTASSEYWKRVDKSDDLRRWVLRVSGDSNLTLAERVELIGERSADTVLAKNVSQLALTDESRMVQDLNGSGAFPGTVLNRDTQSLYLPYSQTSKVPTMVGNSTAMAEAVNRVIENRGLTDASFKPQTQVFIVNPLRGRLVEVNQ
jgi:prepilin-type N-terminal cleavage/methylation domain-containing protein